MDKNRLESWDVWDLQFPATHGAVEKLRFLLNYAVLAPSSRNAQPWVWEIEDETLNLYADLDRALPISDPGHRELIISCGAALQHLRLALRHFGYRGAVTYFPNPHKSHLLARIGLGESQPPTSAEDLLFWAIPKRHTNRHCFESTELPSQLTEAIGAEAAVEGAWLRVIEPKHERMALVELIAQGDEMQWHDRKFRGELAHWIHSNNSDEPDGIPGHALGLSNLMSHVMPVAMQVKDLGPAQADRDWMLAGGAPALAVLGTDADNPRHWLAAGEALARVLLRACAAGVDASFFNQPVEVPSLKSQLGQLVGRDGFPQLIFRLGYATEKAGPTPRRTPDEVTTTNVGLYEFSKSCHPR